MVTIYGLICPIEGRVRYVGKSKDPTKRLYQHLHWAKTGRYENRHLYNWLRKLQRAKLIPILLILDIVDEKQWPEYECRWIKFFGLNTLCNMNDGGFEPPNPKGRIMSDFNKRRLQEAREKLDPPMKGKHHREKAKQLISQANKGKPKNSEHQHKLRETLRLIRTKRHHNGNGAVNQIDIETGKVIRTWRNARTASIGIGLSPGNVRDTLKGKQKTAGGYRWEKVH